MSTQRQTYNTTYNRWHGMKSRCLNEKDAKYPRYGGRGIKVCDRWMQFENFFADMGDPPSGMTLERKDNNGDYSPENCCWATWVEQANNKRSSIRIRFGRESYTIAQLAQMAGCSYQIMRQKLKRAGMISKVVESE